MIDYGRLNCLLKSLDFARKVGAYGPDYLKSKYTCKYCGNSYSSISSLTASTCSRHPNGAGKGKHAPAL